MYSGFSTPRLAVGSCSCSVAVVRISCYVVSQCCMLKLSCVYYYSTAQYSTAQHVLVSSKKELRSSRRTERVAKNRSLYFLAFRKYYSSNYRFY